MADISNVQPEQIKDISDSLENLSCEFEPSLPLVQEIH